MNEQRIRELAVWLRYVIAGRTVETNAWDRKMNEIAGVLDRQADAWREGAAAQRELADKDAKRYRYLMLDSSSDVEIITKSNADRCYKVSFWLNVPEAFFDQNNDGEESLSDAVDAAMSEDKRIREGSE